MVEALFFEALWESFERPNDQPTPRAGPLPITEPESSVELSSTVELEYSAEFLSMAEPGQTVRFLNHLDFCWPSFSSSALPSRTPKKAVPEFDT